MLLQSLDFLKLHEEKGVTLQVVDMQSDELRRALESVTVETLTPIEAMNVLYQLKQLL